MQAAPAARWPQRLALAGVVVAASSYAVWVIVKSYFFQDDFVDLPVAHRYGVGAKLLQYPIFGHFVPGYNLVNYWVASAVPYQWWRVLLFEGFFVVLGLVLLAVLARLLVGEGWLMVGIVAFGGTWFALLPSLAWWASGLEQVVAIPAVLLVLIAQVCWLESRRWFWLPIAFCAMAVAVSFYDGALVSALFVAASVCLFWPAGPRISGALRGLVRAWPLLAVVALPTAADLAWRFSHPKLYTSPVAPTLGVLLRFLQLSWTHTMVPLVGGLDTWLVGSRGLRGAAIITGQLVFVGLLVASLLWRRRAWRAWAVFGVCFLANALLVGISRAGLFGADVASDVRYVAARRHLPGGGGRLFASGRPRTVPEEQPAHPQPLHSAATNRPRSTVLRGAVAAVAVAAAVAYLGALNFDRRHQFVIQGAQGSRQEFGSLASSWARVHAADRNAFVWDTAVSPDFVSTIFFPYNTVGWTLAKVTSGVVLDQVSGSGYVVGVDGQLHRAEPHVVTSAVVPEGGACLTTADRPGGLVVQLARPLGPRRWFGRISYSSTTGALAYESGGTFVRFRKGAGQLITTFPPVAVSAVSWTLPAHSQLCVYGLDMLVPKLVPPGG